MNYEADELLDHIDQWKFKLADKLRAMTPQQRAAFWQQAADQARNSGLPVAEHGLKDKRVVKRRRAARTK